MDRTDWLISLEGQSVRKEGRGSGGTLVLLVPRTTGHYLSLWFAVNLTCTGFHTCVKLREGKLSQGSAKRIPPRVGAKSPYASPIELLGDRAVVSKILGDERSEETARDRHHASNLTLAV